MSHIRTWSFTAKVLTVSATGLILSLGLCSVGTGFEGQVTPLQNVLANVGGWLFVFSVLGIIIGILFAIVSAIRGYK